MINIADPTHTASDLHDLMVNIWELFDLDGMDSDIVKILKRYTDEKDLPQEYLSAKSYDMKTIILSLVQTDPKLQESWDREWIALSKKYNYSKFATLGFLHRKTFQDIRKSYLMYVVGRNILKDPPSTFGILQYLTEKFINDVIADSQGMSHYKIVYEDFDGQNQVMYIDGGSIQTEEMETRPQSYWVGKSVFDSFYMIPLLEYKTRKWRMIPVDLIRSFHAERSSQHGWGGADSWGDDPMSGDENEF